MLSKDLLKIIASFLINPSYKLLDWVSADLLNYYYLSKNPNAIYLLEQNMNKVNWFNLSVFS